MSVIGSIWNFKACYFKLYFGQSHLLYISGDLTVWNLIQLFESPCVAAVLKCYKRWNIQKFLKYNIFNISCVTFPFHYNENHLRMSSSNSTDPVVVISREKYSLKIQWIWRTKFSIVHYSLGSLNPTHCIGFTCVLISKRICSHPITSKKCRKHNHP